jgi:acetolactate synthase regulatory subunit
MKTSILLVLFAVVGLAQSQPDEPKESAEHTFARLNYESSLDRYRLSSTAIRPILTEIERLSGERTEGNNIAQLQHNMEIGNKQDALFRQADRIKLQIALDKRAMDTLNAQLEHVDDCLKIYNGTIDKKTSDMTVRETGQVKACQSITLYPPEK